MLTFCVVKSLNRLSYSLKGLNVTYIFKMPEISKAVPTVLQDNLKQSQNLIVQLKEEVKQLRSILKEKSEIMNIKKFKEENNKLECEVNLLKKELTTLQVANGVQQIPIPGQEEDTKKQLPPKSEKISKPVESNNNKNQVASSVDNSSSNENKPAKAPKPKKAAPPPVEEPPVDVGRLDIRVGQILSAKIHPDADQLYVESIDVGDATRTVVSGLVKFVPISELEKRMVLVLCNLKPQKMRGVLSEAMVLCASTPEKVELLSPPEGAKAGDKVTVPGYTRNPDLPCLNPKKKIFEKVAEDLKVDSEKRASFKNVPWEVEGKPGHITAQTLSGCYIK